MQQIKDIERAIIDLEYKRGLEKIKDDPDWKVIAECNEKISNLERKKSSIGR